MVVKKGDVFSGVVTSVIREIGTAGLDFAQHAIIVKFNTVEVILLYK